MRIDAEGGAAPAVTARRVREGESGAEILVAALTEFGVDVVFLNPGTDTAPVQEALARRAAEGLGVPRVVMCPHESVALAAAHAYYAVTGRPQVVMVHVDVGTQNLGAMLHNAARAEAGVVIIAGRTPVTSRGELPGGRDLVVHWHQDVPDQVGTVRSYTKAALELSTPRTLAAQLARALQIAASAPAGPMYLTVAREVLVDTAPAGSRPAVSRLGIPSRIAGDPEAIAHAAGVLAAAEHPVITTTRVGRTPEAVAELVRVAELLHAPVVERRERMNFPTDHPLYLADGDRAAAALRGADVVLVVDSDVPWVPLRVAPPEAARVVQIDADPVKASVPGWDFPADVCVQADPLLGLRQLAEALETRDGTAAGAMATMSGRMDTSDRTQAAEPGSSEEALQARTVVAALDGLLRPDDIVLDESVTNGEEVRAGVTRTLPGTWFQSGGSGLGWALGGAVGARLAAPDRRVVAVVGDGTFLFASPTAALWTAATAEAPVLVLVLANGGYAASCRPVFELYPDGVSGRNREVVGTRFGDLPDLAAIAAACGAHAEHVWWPADAREALRRGFDAVETGRSAVIVAHVSSPWITPTVPDDSLHRQRSEESRA